MTRRKRQATPQLGMPIVPPKNLEKTPTSYSLPAGMIGEIKAIVAKTEHNISSVLTYLLEAALRQYRRENGQMEDRKKSVLAVRAPLAGKVVSILVKVGDEVEEDETVLLLSDPSELEDFVPDGEDDARDGHVQKRGTRTVLKR